MKYSDLLYWYSIAWSAVISSWSRPASLSGFTIHFWFLLLCLDSCWISLYFEAIQKTSMIFHQRWHSQDAWNPRAINHAMKSDFANCLSPVQMSRCFDWVSLGFGYIVYFHHQVGASLSRIWNYSFVLEHGYLVVSYLIICFSLQRIRFVHSRDSSWSDLVWWLWSQISAISLILLIQQHLCYYWTWRSLISVN